jgi:phage-related protein
VAENSLGTAVLELDVDSDKYSRGLKDAEGQAESFGTKSSKAVSDAGSKMDDAGTKATGLGSKLGSVASIAGGFIVAQGITQVGGYLMDAAKAAAADEQATMRLQQTLHNLGGDYDSNLAKVNAAITSGQELAFTDDEVRDSFQTLAVATGDTDEALSRQKLAMDLARGAGIPLAAATKMVSKVNEESVDTFKRLGINIADGATEAEALAAVQAKFAGQSDTYAKSTAGQFEVAQIKMAEAQETIGTALLPAMTAIANVVGTILPPAFEVLGVVIGVVGRGIQFLIDHAEPLLPVFIGIGVAVLASLIPALIAAIPLVLAKAAAWMLVAVAMIAANLPFILIVAAIALVVAGIVLLIQHWDTIVEKVPALGIAIDAVKEAFHAFIDWITGTMVPALQSFMQSAINAFQGIVSFVQSIWPTLETIITPVLDLIKLYVQTTFDAIKLIIDTVINVIQGIIKVALGIITGDWDLAWEGIRQITDAIWGLIKGLVELYLGLIQGIIEIALGVISGIWDSLWNQIKDTASNIWSGIRDVISNITSEISGIISSFVSTIGGYWETAKSALYSVRDTFYALRDGVVDAISGALGWIQSLIDKIRSIPSPSSIVSKIPGFAGGTQDFYGGIGLVGEKGPELAALPRHTKIYPANETRSILKKGLGSMREMAAQGGAGSGAQVAVNFLGPTRISAEDIDKARQAAENFAWASMAALRARGLR